jgi:hypothetical protein
MHRKKSLAADDHTYDKGARHNLFLLRDPARISGSPLSFGCWHAFSVFWDEHSFRWRTRVEQYKYQITDENAHELFAFHWDPTLNVSFPHMHLGFAMRGHTLPIDNKAHIPTGRVSLADVVTFVISELHGMPLHDDWEQRIAVARQRIADIEG